MRSTKLPWYIESCEDKLTPSMRKLLEEYSHIPADEVVPHIYKVVSTHCRTFFLYLADKSFIA